MAASVRTEPLSILATSMTRPSGESLVIDDTAFPDAGTPQGSAGLSGIPKAVASALRAAGPGDVIAAFGSLSYLHRVKEAYDQITKEGGTSNDR